MRFEKDDSFKQLMKFRLITQKKMKFQLGIITLIKEASIIVFFFLKKKKERRGSEEVRKYNYN